MRITELNLSNFQQINELRRSEREQGAVPDKFEETGHGAAVAFLKDKDLSKYAVTMTELHKVGVNPQSVHDTPIGIYFYPADYYVNTAENDGLPYQESAPYIQILELTSNKILYLKQMTQTQYLAETKKLAKIPIIKKKFQSTLQKAINDARSNARIKSPSGHFWYVLWVLSNTISQDQNKKPSVIWNWLLRQLGHMVVIDQGTRVIHGNEPTQGLIVDPKGTFKWVKTISNQNQIPLQFKKSMVSFNQLSAEEKTKFLRNLTLSERKRYVQNYPILIRFFNDNDKMMILDRGNVRTIFKYIPNPTVKMQRLAVESNGLLIQYIKNPSPSIQRTAIDSDPSAIRFIETPSKKIQLLSVQYDGANIRFIDNPSEQLQIQAVASDGLALQYLHNPSKKVQSTAVSQNGLAIQYIANPSEDVQVDAVFKNGEAIQYIENPSEKIQRLAVSRHGYAIKYIKNPSEDVQLRAVTENGYAIQFILNQNPSEKIKLTAVKSHGGAIKFIENPSDSVQEAAVKNGPFSIEGIKKPSVKAQIIAVTKNPNTLEYIKRPDKQAIDALLKKHKNLPANIAALVNKFTAKKKKTK